VIVWTVEMETGYTPVQITAQNFARSLVFSCLVDFGL
jgi:hypothetical protein